jgi:hypothetical protein
VWRVWPSIFDRRGRLLNLLVKFQHRTESRFVMNHKGHEGHKAGKS